ncbi:hypothetical protein AAES_94619 [Amazona aestiva]|uniref:Uncharacterized protein n=1 Tax=Amazona aestiva TaxID=12930 RepID=A0A0Q3MCA3_AMAAE|nr:hypothetical protein AAES_94619 [Amazona aestiva]
MVKSSRTDSVYIFLVYRILYSPLTKIGQSQNNGNLIKMDTANKIVSEMAIHHYLKTGDMSNSSSKISETAGKIIHGYKITNKTNSSGNTFVGKELHDGNQLDIVPGVLAVLTKMD